MPEKTDTNRFANRLRLTTLDMVYKARASHVGSNFSIADLVAVLYGDVLNIDPADPKAPDRDRFILSKGHGGAIILAALAERGFFPADWLDGYLTDGSILAGHVTHHGIPGIEMSTGSLGHGLPVSVGMAIAGKRDKLDYRVFVILSDGELDEGSNWEAILFAPSQQLDNLVVMVDYNKIQSFGRVAEVIDLSPMAEKFRAFGWHVVEIDGHDHAAIKAALDAAPQSQGKPTAIIAHTVKGKGVSFMEDKLEWHYYSPKDENNTYADARAELLAAMDEEARA